ncbi:ATP-binding protein [Dyella telluris]|uniref:Uncharacterized protein n=1 Tax=Dyella telluris TaxID=2763498 RepID=A0A7G8Q7X9_9GAMM|nr:hypothetical protein [Dyella telluris]QNK02887.1 hypothetical protein H8F01_07140 [Dyella telluris]
MDDQVSSVLNGPGPSITLLVGENGAGKSFRLAELAEKLSAHERVIAIGNTPFSRATDAQRAVFADERPGQG